MCKAAAEIERCCGAAAVEMQVSDDGLLAVAQAMKVVVEAVAEAAAVVVLLLLVCALHVQLTM